MENGMTRDDEFVACGALAQTAAANNGPPTHHGFRNPRSAFRDPHSAIRIPHSLQCFVGGNARGAAAVRAATLSNPSRRHCTYGWYRGRARLYVSRARTCSPLRSSVPYTRARPPEEPLDMR